VKEDLNMLKKGLITSIIGLCLIIAPVGFTLSPAFAKAPKVIELSFSHTIPPVVPIAKVYQAWAGRLAEMSGGRVKINFYWSESLLKAAEFYRGVQTGQTDMTYYALGLDYGLMPLNMFAKLGLLGYPSKEVGTKIYHQIYDKFPEIRAEYKGVKMLSARMGPPYQLHFTKKKVRVPEDLKGMKVISVGGAMAQEMVSMGAATMDVKVGDLYMSLERGLAEGIACHVPILHAFGILKLLPYHIMFKGGAAMGPDMVLMNLKTWNSLPPDIQKIFEELSGWLGETLIKADNGYEGMVIGKAKEMGHTLMTPTPEELEKWKAAVQPTHEKWIADTEAKGLPAKAVYNEAKRLIKEYQ
jgi:TRAP-type C4-dicarboxylate transport system substrate-binding protein